jgi:hypothetical protein
MGMDKGNKLQEIAFKYWQKREFPYPERDDVELWEEFFRLQDTTLKIEKPNKPKMWGPDSEDTKELEVNSVGLKIANYFHPHIWRSHALGMLSPVQAFSQDKLLRRAIRLAWEYGEKISRNALRTRLRTVSGTQVCSNFRPSVAKTIYEKYYEGGNILDPCTGYGGRLVGYLASDLPEETKYIGIDPNEVTGECNKQIALFFEQLDRVKIITSPFEDVSVEELKKQNIGFAFTSPPYFKKEIYQEESINEEQSCHKFDDYEAWLDGFLKIMLQNILEASIEGATCIINIQDVNIKSKKYPLVEDTVKLAKGAGWKFEDKLKMMFFTFGKNLDHEKYESVLIFRKAERIGVSKSTLRR